MKAWAVGLALLLAGVTACTSATRAVVATRPSGSGAVYAALGASETAGAGIPDQNLRFRAAWPQLFFQVAFRRDAVYYNLAVPGITTRDALKEELPVALGVSPTVVTVLFGVNDLAAGVTANEYESNLEELLTRLHRGGKTLVLVANLPELDHLPAFQACLAATTSSITCPTSGTTITTATALNAAVAAYNHALSSAVTTTGAVLVDLHAQGDTARNHPEYIAADGLHPSTLGHQALAKLFTEAYLAHARRL